MLILIFFHKKKYINSINGSISGVEFERVRGLAVKKIIINKNYVTMCTPENHNFI